MALGFITRALQAGLAKLGEASLLDGFPCGNVVLERDVDLFAGNPGRGDDNHTAQADIVVIERHFGPRVGQVLDHPDGRFKLMRTVEDNGYSISFVVVAAPL